MKKIKIAFEGINKPFEAIFCFAADYRNIYFLSFVDLITVLSFDFLTICVSVLNPAFSCSASVKSVLVYDGVERQIKSVEN